MEHPKLIIGSETQGITITVWRRSHPGATDYLDGNWLAVTVDLALGRFRGSIPGYFRAEEFASFQEELRRLDQSLKGAAKFGTMERWFGIELNGDGRGGVRCEGFALDETGIGNRLVFGFQIDQSYLGEMLRSLEEIRAEFPVIGRA